MFSSALRSGKTIISNQVRSSILGDAPILAHRTIQPTRALHSKSAFDVQTTSRSLFSNARITNTLTNVRLDTPVLNQVRFYQQSQSNVNPDPVQSEKREKGEHSQYRKYFKWITPSTVIGSVLALVAMDFAWSLYYDEGLRRAATFWRRAFPIYLHYQLVQSIVDMRKSASDIVEANPSSPLSYLLLPFCYARSTMDEEIKATFDEIHPHYAAEILDIIVSLRGYYIKLGQLGSLRGDFLPDAWIKELEKLQSDAPYVDFETVVQILMMNMGGKNPAEVFVDIDPVPLGAASIGQVHKAKLHDGRDVVVKIMYPGIEETFRLDMATIRSFCKLAQPEHLPYLNEVERQFMTEFDFDREALHLERVHNNMAKSPFRNKVRVPLPIKEFCTSAVLVMEYLPGDNLVNSLRAIYSRMAADQGVSLQDFMLSHQNEIPPSSFALTLYSTFFAITDTMSNVSRAMFNYTFGWFMPPIGYVKTQIPVDIRSIVDTLVQVHGYQMLHDGYFNGDPHPGNILLLPNNKLGLIDFGQVKRLDITKRAMLSRFVIALAQNDQDTIVRMYQVMGHRSKNNNHDVLCALARLGFDYDDYESREGMNIEAYFEKLSKKDPMTQAGDDWVMCSRLSLLLRGLSAALHYPIKTAHRFQPFAEDFLRKYPELDAWVDEYMVKFAEIEAKKAFGSTEETKMIEYMTAKGETIRQVYNQKKRA